MNAERAIRALAGRRAIAPLAALGIGALSLFLVYDHTHGDSLSADEPIHLLSGFLMVERQTAIVNIEHPPLMKLLAGLAMSRFGLPAPEKIPMGSALWDWGYPFLFNNRVPVDTIVAAARAPFLVLFGLLLFLVFVVARRRWGDGPAIFATALCAFDPNLVAHAGVVHTDLGAALTFLAAVLAWDALSRHPSAWRIALAGAALGAALLTKFSSVYLLPILLLQGLLPSLRRKAPGPAIGRTVLHAGLVVFGAGLVVFAVYAVVTARMDRASQRAVIHELVAERGAPRLSRLVEEIATVSPPAGHYLGGLAAVAQQNAAGGGPNYLFGRVRVGEGFPFYFFVAFFAKSAPGFVLFTLLLLAGLARSSGEIREEGRLFLLPVGVLFLASIGTSYNIGIRHMLPVYPFLALAAAGLYSRARRQRHGAAMAWLLAALPLLSAVEVARIHPHELSYFSPLVGGPERGRTILSDSNVDWGLDLRRLAAELNRRRATRPTVAYFGGDEVQYRLGLPDFIEEPVVRGRLVAVSAFYLAEGPEYLFYRNAPRVAAALKRLIDDIALRGRPAGRVGYSIYLFDLPPKEDRR
jgi:4-amino-4-deoxy-L-arabinose transferase-like glycosyltransferase